MWVLGVSVLAFLSVVLLTLGMVPVFSQKARYWRESKKKSYDEELHGLFLTHISSGTVVFLSLGGIVVSFGLAYLLSRSVIFSVLCSGLAYMFPPVLFRYLRKRRVEKFDLQLVDGLAYMANSTKAGLTLVQSMEETARASKPPLAQDLGLILREYGLGIPLDRSIRSARERISSKNFNLVSTAILVNREKGGNLPETLETISSAMREIWRLEEKILAATAEGRKAIRIMVIMPVVIFFMVNSVQPDLVETLIKDPIGNVIFAAALLLYGLGYWWMRRIMDIDI